MATKYPTKDGWLHMRLRMQPHRQISQEAALKLCLFGGNPDDYEVAEFKHFKTVILIILRKKNRSEIQTAYNAGYDCGKNVSTQENCSLKHFKSSETTAAWEEGNQDGHHGRPNKYNKINANNHTQNKS